VIALLGTVGREGVDRKAERGGKREGGGRRKVT